jgi:hypothetical protein
MDSMWTPKSPYSMAREEAHRLLQSSLRDRPRGLAGLESDLLLMDQMIKAGNFPASVDPTQWRAGLQSVRQSCRLALLEAQWMDLR